MTIMDEKWPLGQVDTVLVVPTAIRSSRADAARNRALLLAAAEEEFAERGVDASIADIARRAGVVKGTVFRHFPTKDDLVTEVVGRHYARLTTAAQRLLDAPDAGAALLEFLTVSADELQHQGLTFLQTATAKDPTVTGLRNELHGNIELLVDRARESGAVRADITGTDVLLLMCAPVHIADFLSRPVPDLWRRYVAMIFDGLRPAGATPLPRPAPTWPQGSS